VVFPDKVTQAFNTALITSAEVREFLFHYGVKQFLSDKIAGIGKGATSTMKLVEFNEYFKLLQDGVTKKATGKSGKQISDAEYQLQADKVIEDAQESGDFSEVAEKLKIIARLRMPVEKETTDTPDEVA